MNIKSILFTLAILLCFTAADAQSFSKAANSCQSTCDPSLSAVGQINFGCNRRVFTVNSSRNHPCIIVDYVWTTTDPNATIVDAGGQAMITFGSGAGTYTVCVEFIVGNDANGNGIIDSGESTCSVTSCTTTTTTC